jgi:hypothetical protein
VTNNPRGSRRNTRESGTAPSVLKPGVSYSIPGSSFKFQLIE